MKTAVVILNYNTRNYLEQFLPGLLASCQGQDAKVFVADNASADDSVAFLQTHFPQVPLIRLEKNYGFTGGYNRALEKIEADYYVLINSDIEVPEGWLKPLTDWMDSHPDCGACGPKLLSWQQRDTFEYAGAAGGLLDRYGYPFCRGRILQKVEKDEGQYDSPQNVLWVSGACLMVRSRLWKELGGLDNRFFAHMEEIDLCWRIHLSGSEVRIVTASEVFHLGGGSLPQGNPRKTYLNFRNSLFLLYKNLPVKDGKRMLIIRRLYDTLAFIMALTKLHVGDARAIIKAHFDYRKLKSRYNCQPQENLLKTFPGAQRNIVIDYYLKGKKLF